jgi:hypothetical protein
VRLHGARLSVIALGDIENDGMSMELRRSITFDWPRSIVLEGCSNELTRCLRCMDVANPRLRIPFQLTQRYAHTLPVRLPDTIIAAHKRSQRN